MKHILPQLPYNVDALEPYISKDTLSFHHGKHHQTYVTNLNNLVENTPLSHLSLLETIKETARKDEFLAIFNNAAQVWNHTFYWYCMQQNGGGEPSSTILNLINNSFGSYYEFCSQFKQAALAQFGSGWAWLVEKDNKLSIMKTSNADLPIIHGYKALLTCDIWEHAYYLDYQNRRADYVDTFLNKLINWNFVESIFHSQDTFLK